MKSFFFSLAFLALTISSYAQDGGRNKAIYVEGLGSGLLFSVNYDFRFKPQQDGLGMRVGIGGGNLGGFDANVGIVTVPVLANYLVGTRRVAFEAGAGITPIYVKASAADLSTGDVVKADGLSAFGTLNAGLRLQPIRNGVVFRLTYTPIITGSGFLPLFLGVSLGYAFK
ncbi:hypothetical protein GCM10027275_37730 [Rhabdobacter roseus]|uniref:Outer membrane protein beta-barrel domain-containing protein n=1 Tax=Rhabdobacter roseus TaxID=1655419 RepID=A0A840U095_9BACT|nr:hypothetical protein [Rhabdobacter roseus]MBB5285818.1 hypothetical protein [Rhabdobacter roseus]